jgi:hypothetical protein
MMKILYTYITLVALSFVVATAAHAGQVTSTFAAGDTLTATKMTEVRDAVNDNDTTKQDRVTGTCPAGQSIRVINADGTVTCEVDDNTDTNTTYSPGTGLNLTGTTFSVSGITGAQITNGTITDVDIQDEPGIDFSPALGRTITGTTAGISLCGNATTAYATMTSVSITAPTSGYVLVSANGHACTHTANEYLYVALSNQPGGPVGTFDGRNFITVNSPVARPCAVGQSDTFSFQNVYSVAAGTTTYYVKACVAATTTSANVTVHPVTAIFFPTRY